MNGSVVMPIASLQRICEQLLDRLSRLKGKSIEVENDYFWSIVRDERFDVSKTPTNLTIGQISECWSNLELMLDEPEREITFGLVWLGEIFRSIGDEIVA